MQKSKENALRALAERARGRRLKGIKKTTRRYRKMGSHDLSSGMTDDSDKNLGVASIPCECYEPEEIDLVSFPNIAGHRKHYQIHESHQFLRN
jgi:hypothetical protein